MKTILPVSILEQRPAAHLSSVVECYWMLSLSPQKTNELKDCLPPLGCFDILFISDGIGLRLLGSHDDLQYVTAGSWLMGQQTACYQWRAKSQVCIFGIRLKPFGLFKTAAISPLELKNSIVKLSDISEFNTHKYHDEILLLIEGATLNNCAQLFKHLGYLADKWMMNVWRFMPEFSTSFRHQSNCILETRGHIKLESLYDKFSISKVSLIKNFVNECGLLPKELCKIWRMNHFLILQQKPYKTLADVALQAGYFDQSHLNKEFKANFKHTPKQFFSVDTPLLNSSLNNISQRLNGGYTPIAGEGVFFLD